MFDFYIWLFFPFANDKQTKLRVTTYRIPMINLGKCKEVTAVQTLDKIFKKIQGYIEHTIKQTEIETTINGLWYSFTV